MSKKVIRNLSTEESIEFWASAEEAAKEVATWPAWKRAGINTAQVRPEARGLESEGEEMNTVNVEVAISAKDIVNNLSSSELIQFIIDLDSYSRDYEVALVVFEYFAKEVSDHEAWLRAKGEL